MKNIKTILQAKGINVQKYVTDKYMATDCDDPATISLIEEEYLNAGKESIAALVEEVR